VPTPEQVRAAVDAHFRLWNAGDREGWIANFADDVVFHDPVGAPPKHGRSAAEHSWDNSFTNGQQWTLRPTKIIVCADEAAVTLENHGVVNGQTFAMEGIEIWKVDDDGRVCTVRAYFAAPEGVQLDEYFTIDRDTTTD
jgi:steroid Delta-isomerase